MTMRLIQALSSLLFLCAPAFSLADCRPLEWEEVVDSATLKNFGQLAREVTGCNVVVSPTLQNQEVGKIEVKGLEPALQAICSGIGATLLRSGPTFIIVGPKDSMPILPNTGRLISVHLSDTTVEAVNKIIKEVGGKSFLQGSKPITGTLVDVPIDDIPVLLRFLNPEN